MKIELNQMELNVTRHALERELMHIDNEIDKANDGGPISTAEGIAWKEEVHTVLGKLTKAEADQ